MSIRTPQAPPVTPVTTVVSRELPFLGTFNTPPIILPTDWSRPVTVTRTWLTEIIGSAVGDTEQRVARSMRPLLSAGATHPGLSDEQAGWLLNMLYWASPQHVPQALPRNELYTGLEASALQQFYSWPYVIAADEASVAVPTHDTANTGTILLDTTCRRYSVGGRVWLYPSRIGAAINSIGNQRLPALLYTITAVNPGSIDFAVPFAAFSALDFSEAATNLMAAPAFDALPLESAVGTYVTCTKSRAAVDVAEIQGQNQQQALNTGDVTAYFEYLLTEPVLVPDHNWVSGMDFRFTRSNATRAFGRGSVVVLSGANSRLEMVFEILADRERWWELLNLFDSRQARRGAFWVETDICLFENVVVFGNVVSGLAQRGFDQFKDRFIAGLVFFRADGTYERGLISPAGFAYNAGNGTFGATINGATPVPDDTYVKACLLFRGRFASDTLEERWETCELVRSTFSVVEIGSEPRTLEID